MTLQDIKLVVATFSVFVSENIIFFKRDLSLNLYALISLTTVAVIFILVIYTRLKYLVTLQDISAWSLRFSCFVCENIIFFKHDLSLNLYALISLTT